MTIAECVHVGCAKWMLTCGVVRDSQLWGHTARRKSSYLTSPNPSPGGARSRLERDSCVQSFVFMGTSLAFSASQHHKHMVAGKQLLITVARAWALGSRRDRPQPPPCCWLMTRTPAVQVTTCEASAYATLLLPEVTSWPLPPPGPHVVSFAIPHSCPWLS